MADRPGASSEAARTRMLATRQRDTAAEMALRRELHRRGLRYRVDVAVVSRRRRVDVLFAGAKVAVFVDGCFWHSCPEHRTMPRSNAAWWRAKLAANVERDERSTQELRDAGYVVVRVWEHEDAREAADRVEAIVRERTRASERLEGQRPKSSVSASPAPSPSRSSTGDS